MGRMSEIEIVRQYDVKCDTCGEDLFRGAYSLGTAEDVATNHIDDVNSLSGESNYNHTVSITEVTKVGRNI